MSAEKQPQPSNPSLLVAGLEDDLFEWLGQRLPESVALCQVRSASELLSETQGRSWSLLLIEDRLPDASLEQALRSVREVRGVNELQLVCILNAGERRHAGRLIAETGIQRLMFQPIDRDELAHYLATLLAVSLRPAAPEAAGQDAASGSDTKHSGVASAVAQLWLRFRQPALNRVAVLEKALTVLDRDELDGELCQRAEQEAHKLAGSVGTFGFIEASRIARQIEHIFLAGREAAANNQALLQELVPRMRQLLEGPGPEESQAEGGQTPSGEERPYLLVVDHDAVFAAQLIREAALKGMHAVHVATHDEALMFVAKNRPQVVILELSHPDGKERSLELLHGVKQREPAIPALVLTESDVFDDRIAIARLGGEGALSRNQPPVQILEWVGMLLDRLNATRARVLAVDDDPQVLSAVRALLEPRGVLLTTLEDPLNFWETLEEVGPDLLMLDVDMPHISGLELCRLVRGDPRWSSTPVLFLSAHTNPDMIQRIFSAGADDYVSKPIVGPELMTRITNRLERTQLYRTLAETDALTKVASRRKSIQVIRQFLKLSERHRQPFCLAIIDVDCFKQINDVHGHSLGDQVLQRFGQLLLQNFRSEDVVGRWGGDEFVVGMYGMKGESARQRLINLLEELKIQAFSEAGQPALSVTFTAGIAEAPRHGRDLQHLYLAADRALYLQKEAGRGQVSVLSDPMPDQASGIAQTASV